DFRVRMERNRSSCSVRFTVSHHFQTVHGFSSLIPLLVDLTFMINLYFQPGRKSIYYRSSHAVKAAGYLVAPASELSSCMKDRKYYLYGRNSGFVVDSHRDTSSVIYNCN